MGRYRFALLGSSLLQLVLAILGVSLAWYHVDAKLFQVEVSLWEKWWNTASRVLQDLGEDKCRITLNVARVLVCVVLISSCFTALVCALEVFKVSESRKVAVAFSVLSCISAVVCTGVWAANMPWEDGFLVFGPGFFCEAIAAACGLVTVGLSLSLPTDTHVPTASVVYARLLD